MKICFRRILPAVFFVAAGMSPLLIPAAAEAAPSLGVVDFSISCAAESQPGFNRALALTHHMMYGEARREFEAVAAEDPDCAMAYWGVAMTHFHPLWAPPGKEELTLGRQAVKRATELTAPTKREQAHILAAKAFYQDWETVGHRDRTAAWRDAQEKVHRDFPDDFDAIAFYALSLLAAAPKDDTTFAAQKMAGEILEELHERAPEHPAGFHYLIHAYDNPLLARQAVEVARAYDSIAPDVPHTLHMPTHIFVRLGLWADVVEWSARSAAAALAHPAGEATSLHYAHAMDYLIYGHLQIGEDEEALESLEKLKEVDEHQDSFAAAYALAAAGGRYLLERGEWAEAARYSIDSHPEFPWSKYPQFESIAWYTRSLGAARSNNNEEADKSTGMLEVLYEKSVQAGQDYWPVILDCQIRTVSAWIAFTGGEREQALINMHAAADCEDRVDKHPVTPGAVLPARELLGDMLLLDQKYAEAVEAYETSLEIAANRYRSLYGAARAAELGGLTEKALTYYGKLLAVTAGRSVARPEVKQARDYLRENRSGPMITP